MPISTRAIRHAHARAAVALAAAAIGAALAGATPAVGADGGVAPGPSPAPEPTAGATERIELRSGGAAATVRHGTRLVLSGRHSSGRAGRRVALQFAARGGRFQTVATRRSGTGGRFRFRARAERNGRYRAVARVRGRRRSLGSATLTVIAGLSAKSPTDVLRGSRVRVSGSVRPRRARRSVLVEASRAGGRWRRVARARTGVDGAFRATWRPRRLGNTRLRVRFRGDRMNAGATTAARTVTVYRRARASWYGPGLYGNRTACGQILRPDTEGVAHRTLPCGTRVRLRYRGRETTVPVIDRGPHVAGRVFDLAPGTRAKLRFEGVQILWATR
jgi:rare lipoprotein A